jgi:anti-anti-sigma factor
MTALLDSGALCMTFICDGCGGEENTRPVTGDAEMVWPLVSSLGWTGSAFATGTHLCPACSSTPLQVPAARTADAPARPQGATCDVRVHDDAAVVTPLSDVDLTVVEPLREILTSLLLPHRIVLVDLHAAGVIDSAGLSLLVRAHNEAKQHGGALVLTAPSRYVQTVLHTMRLDGVFETYPDTGEALTAIHHRPIVKGLSSD